jgi:hypothetical protein
MQQYKKKDIEAKSLKAIKEHRLFFINDIPAYLPCCRATFYNLGLDKLDSIKDSLEQNKIETKNSMRAKWYKSDNATLQIALMKLISSDDERRKMSQNYNEMSGRDGDELVIRIVEDTKLKDARSRDNNS